MLHTFKSLWTYLQVSVQFCKLLADVHQNLRQSKLVNSRITTVSSS